MTVLVSTLKGKKKKRPRFFSLLLSLSLSLWRLHSPVQGERSISALENPLCQCPREMECVALTGHPPGTTSLAPLSTANRSDYQIGAVIPCVLHMPTCPRTLHGPFLPSDAFHRARYGQVAALLCVRGDSCLAPAQRYDDRGERLRGRTRRRVRRVVGGLPRRAAGPSDPNTTRPNLRRIASLRHGSEVERFALSRVFVPIHPNQDLRGAGTCLDSLLASRDPVGGRARYAVPRASK
ncbi:hypothetical protein OF83DRAFT_604689 [Amylostereum chailletii]|nr:hypothetical protein OF83DRAFT_604689 [Amylostereum chailletii]